MTMSYQYNNNLQSYEPDNSSYTYCTHPTTRECNESIMSYQHLTTVQKGSLQLLAVTKPYMYMYITCDLTKAKSTLLPLPFRDKSTIDKKKLPLTCTSHAAIQCSHSLGLQTLIHHQLPSLVHTPHPFALSSGKGRQ